MTKSAETKESTAFHTIISISAIPSPKALVDATVRVFGRLGAGQLLLHAFHTSAERVAAFAAFWLWGLEIHALLLGRGAALGVQAAIRVLAFLALPCW